jgi:hypothetical protein
MAVGAVAYVVGPAEESAVDRIGNGVNQMTAWVSR